MAFASLTASLNLNIADFSAKLTAASRDMTRFAKNLSSGYKSANDALNRHVFGLKDTSRIIQGILVSQAFYTIAGSIRDATSALMSFNEELDYAKVTYSALFGDADLAGNFINVLQEKSVDTIFEYSDLAGISKKLLAYGIEYENLMYTINGLTNLGAMSGDTAALDRIALAMGQIQTTGYLAATEMRQLANAYVPIYDIVQDAFGLSGEQMQNVGDLKLPAYQVLNAIVDYANAAFGDVGEAAMLTVTGLKNRVVDTIKVMGSEMTMPLTQVWKSFLLYAADALEDIRTLYNTRGSAGIFEALVPDPGMQTNLRAFFANLHNLILTITSALSAVGSVLRVMAEAFIIAFNIIGPPIMGVVNILSGLVKVILDNSTAAGILRGALIVAAAAFVLLKVHAIGALVVTAVTKAIANLSKALLLLSSIVTKHPILMLLAGLTVALVGVSAASNNADNSLSSLFKNLSSLGGGVSQEDIFKDLVGDPSEANPDPFDNPFEESTKGAEEFGDAIEGAGNKAKKAANGLLSFDEVFKLPEKSDSAYDGAGYDAGSISDIIKDLGGLGTALGESLIPDIPDFTEFINGFTDDLFGGLFDKIKSLASGAASGALIGGLVGFAIGALVTKTMAGALAGAKYGTTIGTAAGAGFAYFWEDTYAALEETLQGIAAGGAMGALVGGLVGLLIGAFATRTMAGALTGARYGSAIGTLAGGALGGIFSGFSDELTKRITAIAWGSATGMLFGGLVGLLLGAFATKSLAGAMTGAKYGTAIAAGIGAVIGGTLEGAFGDVEATIGDRLSNMFSSIEAASYGAVIGGLVGMIIGAIVGAMAGGIGALPGAKLGATLGSAIGGLGAMFGEYLANSGITEAMAEWFGGMWDTITTGIENGWEDAKEATSNGWAIVQEVTTDAQTGINTAYIAWWDGLSTKLSTWWDGVKTDWSTGWETVKQVTTDSQTGINTAYTAWWDGLSSKLSTWWSGVKTGWSNGWAAVEGATSKSQEDIRTAYSTWWNNLSSNLDVWFAGVSNKITNKLNSIKTTWSTKWDSIKTNLSTWWDGLKTSMGTWLETKIWQPISNFFNLSNFWNRIKGMLDAIKRAVAAWWDGVKSIFSGGISISGIANAIAGVGSTITPGHATGGVFNREHIARFAEGNKAEAIIPLENATAMRPFVDAVSQGIIEGLAPTLMQTHGGSGSDLPPMYVGTLVADERGLKQLYKKFEIIQAQENARRGVVLNGG